MTWFHFSPWTFPKLLKRRLFSKLKIFHSFDCSLKHSFKIFFHSVSILQFACICWTIKLHDHGDCVCFCSLPDPRGPALFLAPGWQSINIYWTNKMFFYLIIWSIQVAIEWSPPLIVDLAHHLQSLESSVHYHVSLWTCYDSIVD